MKTQKLTSIFLMAIMLFAVNLFAQEEREDVIYMKNGAIYRGTIIEQVPNVSYKIEIAGGSVINVSANDVLKVTKEVRKHDEQAIPRHHLEDNDKPYEYKKSRRGKVEQPFVYRKKGYFFQSQLMFGFFEFGTRIVNGYKFGQFGLLGLGVGVDLVIGPVNGGGNNNGTTFPLPNINYDYAGPQFPVFIYYSGDILRKKTTPFYAVEVGYAFRPHTVFNSDDVSVKGGMMGSVGFGLRAYNKGRKNISLSLNLDIKNPTNQTTAYSPGYTYTYSESMIMLMPSFKLGIGF